jgi:hypothetical protein
MTFGRLDYWEKKIHTWDCNKKHKITHTKLQKNTKLHSRKQKITYQAIEKTIELHMQKQKIVNQIVAKNNQKNHIPDCSKNSNLNHTKIVRKNTHNRTTYCRQQNTHTKSDTKIAAKNTKSHSTRHQNGPHKQYLKMGGRGTLHLVWGSVC